MSESAGCLKFESFHICQSDWEYNDLYLNAVVVHFGIQKLMMLAIFI